MKLSVIITTYNSEDWLRKVLIGYSVQTETDFELVIADDGSTIKTQQIIESFSSKFKYPILHVWQEDNGFRKSEILNKAILKATADYLLFTDGDCIPRENFVKAHLKHQQKGYFLSGGYFKLPLHLSTFISENDIINQNCFSIKWLVSNGLNFSFKVSKLSKNKYFASFMNWVTTTKKTFNGHNSSVFKEDLLAINGFNQDMHYGGLDREVGERLFNLGILAKQIRYDAICLHLHHERGYADQEKIAANIEIRRFNIKHNIIRIKNGIVSE
ncbi:glycosyltransferase [Flavobacterium sp. LMO8]|uniref:glycosyltransferase family 2 protein n=1 Tax=Flavobacterium sp. LMO8 TaxID=2654244 RepID=UPI001290C8F5|nr:glycosyltransferase family 2 protein [Flavobacterium sp. LMO8]MQP24099.1 glycosyltransferase [Flavobacterium sp. LMO8]